MLGSCSGAYLCGRAAELAALREENEALRDALRRLSLQAAPAELARGLQVVAAAASALLRSCVGVHA